MERIIKLSICLLVTLCTLPVMADVPVQQPLGAPQVMTLPQCIKTFNVGYDKLLFLTEAAISGCGFEVEEIQTKGGYIVFTALNSKYLATIMNFGNNKAILKISPCNNNYTFPAGIVRNIFRYIEVNQYKKF